MKKTYTFTFFALFFLLIANFAFASNNIMDKSIITPVPSADWAYLVDGGVADGRATIEAVMQAGGQSFTDLNASGDAGIAGTTNVGGAFTTQSTANISGDLTVQSDVLGQGTITATGGLYGELTGNAATATLATTANAGDSATSFFPSGELEVARGGTGVTTFTNLIVLGDHTTGNYAAGDGEAGNATSLTTDSLDTLTEIAAALKSGADATLVTGTKGGSGNCAEWNADGDLVEAASAAACGSASGGDNVSVNGIAVDTTADFIDGPDIKFWIDGGLTDIAGTNTGASGDFDVAGDTTLVGTLNTGGAITEGGAAVYSEGDNQVLDWEANVGTINVGNYEENATHSGGATGATVLTLIEATGDFDVGGDVTTIGTMTVAGSILSTYWGDGSNLSSMPREVCFIMDGGGSAVSTGEKAWVRVNDGFTITGMDITADQSGSAVVDLWKDTYTNFPPTNADSICDGGTCPTLSAAQKGQDTTLTSWTTLVTEGDYITANVDSAATIELLEVCIYGTN